MSLLDFHLRLLAELEEGAEGEGEGEGDARGKQNRNEKKARKALQKLGLKPVPGVAKVTVKKAKQVLFVVVRPDVFKAPTSDTYVIFGEAKVEDPAAAMQAEAAQQFMRGGAGAGAAAAARAAAVEEAPAAGGEEEAGEEDASGLEEKDIKLVMDQAGVPRSKAVKALKKNNGDIVSAIMDCA